MRFDCVSRTHVGLRRKINEDSLFVGSERGLWAVADGMGGHDAGEVASAMVVNTLRRLPDIANLDALVEHAVEGIREVNRELIDLARGSDSKRIRTIGTTVVSLAIRGSSFRCFWMGDSRAYRLRGNEITRISRDHSLVQNLIDAGMLKPDEAEAHENANLITRAVGAADDVDVDIVTGDVQTNDQFLLASDGLTRVVQDEEMAEQLTSAPPDQAADKLIEMVLERGAPDNVSLIIIKVSD